MTGGAYIDPPDDPKILDCYKVLRRVVPDRYSRHDGKPESSTFRKDGDGSGTSVTLWLEDTDLRITREPHPTFGVIGLYVRDLREQGLTIAYVWEDGNPNHCEIYGERSSGKRKTLAKLSKWVVYPEGYPANFSVHPLWTLDAE